MPPDHPVPCLEEDGEQGFAWQPAHASHLVRLPRHTERSFGERRDLGLGPLRGWVGQCIAIGWRREEETWFEREPLASLFLFGGPKQDPKTAQPASILAGTWQFLTSDTWWTSLKEHTFSQNCPRLG